MWVCKIDENGLYTGRANIKAPAEGESLPAGHVQAEAPELPEDGRIVARWNGDGWTMENAVVPISY